MTNKATKAKDHASTRLKQMRSELASAEQDLVAAESAMDLDEVVALRQRVEAARTFVRALEHECRDELENEGKEKAVAWIGQHAAQMSKAVKAVEAAQVEVRAAVEAAVEAIKKEAQARKAIEGTAFGSELLAARFGIPADKVRQDLPPLIDWAGPVFNAVESMRPSRHARTGLIVAVGASASPEQKRAAQLRAVAQWCDRHRSSLPDAVRDILEAAPIPPEALTNTKRGPSEREQREMKAMAKFAKETADVLSLANGHVAGTV